MISQLHAGLATGAALVYCTLTGVCQSIPPEIPIRMVQEKLIVVSVQLNGKGPFDFLLDTGTDFTIIDSALADKLGSVRSGHMEQVSLAGERMVDRSTLDTITLGRVRAENLPVLVEDLSPLRKTLPRIQGILSQDFLARFNYLIDYSKHKIRIESGNEFRDSLIGLRMPLEPRHDLVRDKMIVTVVAQVSNQTTLRLVLDSGATSVVLARDAWKRLKIPIQHDRWEQTPTGNVAVHTGPIHQITVGSERLHEVLAASSTASGSQVGDGLLPTSLFDCFYVNNRENFVVLNPRSEASSHRHQ